MIIRVDARSYYSLRMFPPQFHEAIDDRRLDVSKRFTEEQIIGFLREAEAGLAVTQLFNVPAC
ncbi:hypothetical protein DIC66_13840 [Rhodoferax lacus]|uniref:Uncharacterized protein n=1 Tax=Rhodoferax lacus TaxID=2184758 RepID=A0A3E1RBF1_9BURK|nr:hypothetical protein DIC66_13840 [Rhodoferax lacus]